MLTFIVGGDVGETDGTGDGLIVGCRRLDERYMYEY